MHRLHQLHCHPLTRLIDLLEDVLHSLDILRIWPCRLGVSLGRLARVRCSSTFGHRVCGTQAGACGAGQRSQAQGGKSVFARLRARLALQQLRNLLCEQPSGNLCQRAVQLLGSRSAAHRPQKKITADWQASRCRCCSPFPGRWPPSPAAPACPGEPGTGQGGGWAQSTPAGQGPRFRVTAALRCRQRRARRPLGSPCSPTSLHGGNSVHATRHATS